MKTDPLTRDLRRIGRRLRRWGVEYAFALWGAVSLGCLWLASAADYWLQFTFAGRIACCLVLAGIVVVALVNLAKRAARRYTLEGIAAAVEEAFPALDNRLINHVQFAEAAASDAFKASYVAEGIPGWCELPVRTMRNRREFRGVWMGFAFAVALLVACLVIDARNWTNCIVRVVNPFAARAPVSATRILAVTPGDASVVRGKDLVIKCAVIGRPRHTVRLDVKPVDGPRNTVELGRVGESEDGEFRHRISRVTADMKYRFRAGDAPNPPWYSVTTQPPLAFSIIKLHVKPPAYTRLKTRSFDALTDEVEVPQGAEISALLVGNSPLESVTVQPGSAVPQALAQNDDGGFSGTFVFDKGQTIVFHARNLTGDETEAVINLRVLPDAAPVIEVVSPKARTVLGPDGVPNIQFTVRDDYGLADVTVERARLGEAREAQRVPVKVWDGGGRAFAQMWKDSKERPLQGKPVAFYIVARDACPLGTRVSRSKPVIFDAVSMETAANVEAAEYAKAASTLTTLIEMQRANLRQTKHLRDDLATSTESQWDGAAAKQETIRSTAESLLNNPHRPLGAMTTSVREMHRKEMVAVVQKLESVPDATGAVQGALADECVTLEETILRKLTYADLATDQTHRKRIASGLFAMLTALIKGETVVLDETRNCVDPQMDVSDDLVNRQDELAADVADFIAACRREIPMVETSDAAFTELLATIADTCDEEAIRTDMLRAAEQLEANAAAKALPHEEIALAKLKRLHDRMSAWQTSEAETRLDDVREALDDASDRLHRLKELQAKLIEQMKLTELQGDQSNEETDMLADEIAEMQKNIKESLLEIPRDLHIYPELSVANELIEDVYSVFEDVLQAEGTEAMTGESATEMGVLKPDDLLEAMAEAEGRLDDMEMWLGDRPDSTEFNMEPFDRAEMPMMALGELPGSFEDLIGALLKESESLAEASEDSATNLGMSDFPPGWEVAEGPIESFGAQGKSGNQVPDHKEQSGRSIVGRQGQAIGETAAGSGTIGEGDRRIENRITPEPLQSGQVQADGEADENATGGGKQASGSADQLGMSGAGSNRRLDSNEPGSLKGLEALLARTQAAYVKGSLMNLRTESLAEAAHHMRQAGDAVSRGLPITEIREYQRRAIASLKRARTELNGGVGMAIDDTNGFSLPVQDVTESGESRAPTAYRQLVAEYFKSLSESL